MTAFTRIMALKYRLTYFNIRGAGELARLMFAYAKIPYEDIRIERELKPKQPFGKLPVLEVDGVQIAESRAIYRYLAEEFGLTGNNKLEAARSEMILSVLHDVLLAGREYFLEQDEANKEELKKKYSEETLLTIFPLIQKQLKANGTGYFVGDSITVADIAVASIIDEMKTRFLDIVDNLHDLSELSGRILNIPAIKEWIEKRPKTLF